MANGNGGDTALKFQDWLEQYQHDQELQNQHISQLSKDVAHLTATLQSLVDNQKGLFSRANRPINWGAIIGGVTLLGICAGLLVAPMNATIKNLTEFHNRAIELELKDAREMGRLEVEVEWLKALEERQNDRLHSRYGME